MSPGRFLVGCLALVACIGPYVGRCARTRAVYTGAPRTGSTPAEAVITLVVDRHPRIARLGESVPPVGRCGGGAPPESITFYNADIGATTGPRSLR